MIFPVAVRPSAPFGFGQTDRRDVTADCQIVFARGTALEARFVIAAAQAFLATVDVSIVRTGKLAEHAALIERNTLLDEMSAQLEAQGFQRAASVLDPNRACAEIVKTIETVDQLIASPTVTFAQSAFLNHERGKMIAVIRDTALRVASRAPTEPTQPLPSPSERRPWMAVLIALGAITVVGLLYWSIRR